MKCQNWQLNANDRFSGVTGKMSTESGEDETFGTEQSSRVSNVCSDS